MVKNRLKEIRMREYMLNMKEFAKLLDINYVQYIGYEKGTVPYLEVALRISKKLNRSIDDIFYLEE
ncbi:MAG: helix-turn-helix domain-containing protein [Tissierella sp.]|nr:helix-turn-helix domain-containing protein [Tissierella sp.]